MSNQNNFLTLPSRQSFFTAIKNGRTPEGSCSSPVEDEDEEEVDETRLIPRSSPVPRKRGHSIFDETAEYMKMRMGLPSRRVSFADAGGGELVQVREFVAFESNEGDESEEEQEQEQTTARYSLHNSEPIYSVRPDFHLPNEAELLFAVHNNKVELEKVSSVEDEPLAFTGLIRVLNISFHKSVYVRFTMDGWRTFFDYPAEYLHGSNNMETDQFTFKLSFAQPYIFPGARIDFVVRYESAEGEYWANNCGKNYSVVLNLTCKQQLALGKEPGEEVMKGILKATSYRMETDTKEAAAVESEGGNIREKPSSVSVLPRIIQPEIDVENVDDAMFSPPSKSSRIIESEDDTFTSVESFKEQPPLISSAIEKPIPLTIRSPVPRPEVESYQEPDLEQERSPTWESGDDATSPLNISSSSQYATEIAPGSYVEHNSSIIHSTSAKSSQVTEYDPQISDVVKVPLQQNEVQPKTIVSQSLDSVDPDRNSQIQEQQSIAPRDFGSPDAEESIVEFRQEVGDYGSGSPEETKEFVIMAEEEEVMRISETRLGLESEQSATEGPGTGASTMVPTTSGTYFGSDGRRIQCHANSDTEYTFPPSHLRRDLQHKMDDPVGISVTDYLRPLDEAHDSPVYKLLKERSMLQFGITSEATGSQDVTGKISGSPEVTVEPAELQNVSGEVAGSQDIVELGGTNNATAEVAGLQTVLGEGSESQDIMDEITGSQDVSGEVAGLVSEIQNVKSEVAGLQHDTGKVVELQNGVTGIQTVTGEVTELQDIASEVGELQDITGKVTGSQKVTGEIAQWQNVTGEVAGSQGLTVKVTESKDIAGKAVGLQNVTDELTRLQHLTVEVTESQDMTGEVTELQNVTVEIVGSHNVTGEAAGSQNITDEIPGLKIVTGEVTGLQDITGEVTESKDVAGEVVELQNVTDELTRLQHLTAEVTGSQNIAGEVTELQNVPGEVAGSQDIADEVPGFKSVIGEIAGSHNVTGEVTGSQDITDEVAGSQDVPGEVPRLKCITVEVTGTQDITDEVAGSLGIRGEVSSSPGVTGEITLSGITGDVTGSLCITSNLLSSAPAASSIILSAEKNDIPVLGDIFTYHPETRVITPQNTDSLGNEELSLNQQIFLDSLVSEVTMSEVLIHQALVKAFVTLVIEVCLVTVITNPSTFLIIGIFFMLYLL